LTLFKEGLTPLTENPTVSYCQTLALILKKHTTMNAHGLIRTLRLLIFIFILLVQISCSATGAIEKEITFESEGVKLTGTICIPDEPYAVVVYVHGSGPQTRNIMLARSFAQNGIAALVYDKRGTGKSGGKFLDNYDELTQPRIELLAKDASAAVSEIIKIDKIKDLPVGLVGISQAGWIIPIAANENSNISFIGLWSGPVCSILEEDIYSTFTHNQEFEPIPPFKDAKEFSKTYYQNNGITENSINSKNYLIKLKIPGLWIFGANDGSIPVDLSIENLKQLRIDGQKNLDYIIFSGKGHNNIEPTFAYMVDWIKTSAIISDKKFRNPSSYDNLIGLYRTNSSTAPPELFINMIEGRLFVEIGNEKIKLNQIEENRFLFFVEDGYHVIRFDISNKQMTIDDFDKYTKVNN
jgi:pimeloyl-ACP methyl ester carboxylesterase